MAIKHDTQGFLTGEPVDLGSATEELSAIHQDTSAIRKSLDELLMRAPATKADGADKAPQIAIRRDGFSNTRDEDYPQTVQAGGRGNFGRGQGSPDLEKLLSKFSGGATGAIVVPSRARANPGASSVGEPKAQTGAQGTAQIVKELRASRISMRQAVTPTRRDRRGRFVAGRLQPEAGAAGNSRSPDSDGMLRAATGDIAGRIANAMKGAVHGAEDVDPAIKAFQEVAGPISQGFQLLGGLGRGDKQERWYRRIFNVLSGFRKDESVANKKTDKRLKAIEDKPVGEEGKGGWWGLILGALAAIAPALLGGLALLLEKLGLGTLAKALRAFTMARFPSYTPGGRGGRPPIQPPVPAGKGKPPVVAPGATPPSTKPSLWQRTKNWFTGGKGAAASGAAAEEAGTAAKASRFARLGRFAGGAARRIPVLGALLSLGFGALGSSAIESDKTTTRQQKNEEQGRNWGGAGGGLAGAVAGAAIGSLAGPVGTIVGGIVGGLVGEWLGSEAGEIIGSKWTAFTDGLSLAWGTVTDVALGTFDWIKGGWDVVATFATGVFTTIGNKASEVWDSLKATVGGAWETLTGLAQAVFDGIKAQLDSVISALKQLPIIGPIITKALDMAKAAEDAAREAARKAVDAAKQRVADTVAGGKLLLSDAGNAMVSAYNEYGPGKQISARHEQRLAQERRPSSSAKKRWGEAKGLIVDAANTAGVDAGTLAKIANFESGFNSDARPIAKDASKNRIRQFDGRMGISSAHGFGQFLDGTWAAMIRQHGEKYGIKGANGLTDAQTQQYRQDKRVQAGMLAEFTKANIEKGRKLGGADDDANVYAFHNLGDGDAPKLLKALSSDPAAKVSEVLSRKVIDGNKSLYGDGSITVSQAYERMGDAMRGGEEFAVDARLAQNGQAPTQVAQQAPSKSPAAPPVVAAIPPFLQLRIPGVAAPAAPIAVASPPPVLPPPSPTVVTPAAPVSVSLSMPSAPAAPKIPAMEEPAQVQAPLASIPSGGLQNKQGQQWKDVGQDLRERGIAHIVTGGLSSSGIG